MKIDKEKDGIAFSPDNFIDMIDTQSKKREIIMWDDVGFLMHTPDTLEKIKEDFIKLFEEYTKAMESPELFFTSIYSAFRKIHIRNVFLIGFVGIITRIERLKTKC